MEDAPVFEEFDPESDCDCPGCIHWRRSMAHALPLRLGGHPAAHGTRRALVLAAAAGTVLGGQSLPAVAAGGVAPGGVASAGVASAGVNSSGVASGGVASVEVGGHSAARRADPRPASDGPGTPQGSASPLHGGAGVPAASTYRSITRTAIIERAMTWITAKVPYSMEKYWTDGYRQDCSGFVSMAWNLSGNEWTGSLDKYGVPITKDQLEPGDILLFHNPANPTKGSHVTIFGGWTDSTRAQYMAYEQAPPHARKQATPYPYRENADRYVAYRFKGVEDAPVAGSGSSVTRYPGARSFGPGANNKYVTQLGKALIARGGKRFYRTGPGPLWTDADRRATQAFQLAQGWRGTAADGLPGPTTWSYLMKGTGRNIPRAGTGPGAGPATGAEQGAPGYPGRGVFRPGQSHPAIERLGRQLVRKGFGEHYARGPGPRWTESDRRNVEAFQRAQGWRGAAADGYPGPETWRRLFR
ncbi:peptidoglycan-binding protein [Streptomyces sp. NRRL S-920]|uniref:peptidoglycan-binding protein n=1 Tax=Streptomyces sp. NRRL S-920 TaxID=1463921 RepID=UPI0004C5B247|nr:peptidoglycan-binding protein [Streptomyces sp. NRRL S-920]